MAEVAVGRWRWTAERYEEAAAAGLFGDEPRVELLAGEVFTVPPMPPGHAAAIRRAVESLSGRLPREAWTIGSQLPVRLDDDSEPEPDVWVARGPAARYDDHHPTAAEVALVVEVSDTSLAFDRTVKLPRYAAAGVPEAWVVSLPQRVVHRFAQPAAGTYQANGTLGPGDDLRCEPLGVSVPVDGLLPAA